MNRLLVSLRHNMSPLILHMYKDIIINGDPLHALPEQDQINFPNTIRGSLNRDAGVYLIGPKGYIDIYFEIDFIFFSKRWSKEIFSFSSFRIPLLEFDFAGSGSMTYWNDVEDINKQNDGDVDTYTDKL